MQGRDTSNKLPVAYIVQHIQDPLQDSEHPSLNYVFSTPEGAIDFVASYLPEGVQTKYKTNALNAMPKGESEALGVRLKEEWGTGKGRLIIIEGRYGLPPEPPNQCPRAPCPPKKTIPPKPVPPSQPRTKAIPLEGGGRKTRKQRLGRRRRTLRR